MTATSVLLIFIGIFVVLNAGNFVNVINGKAKIGPTSINPTNTSVTGTIVQLPGGSTTIPPGVH